MNPMDDRRNPTLEALQARFERLNLLYEVSNVIHSTLDPQQALQLIVSQAVRVTRASTGSVILNNPTTGFLEIEAAHGLPPQSLALRLKVGEGITGWVARTGQPARVGDVSKDERYIMLNDQVRSELAVPLEVAGEIRGVLNVDSDRLDAFSSDDEQLLRDLAVHASQVIHNTWLYEQLRQKAHLFESLITVSQTINSTINLDEALQAITREACVLMGGKMSSLLLVDPAGEWLDLKASFGAGQAYLNKPRLSLKESLVGTVVRRKKPLQVPNVQTSGRYQNTEVARQEGLISLVSVPLVFRGEATGALNVYTSAHHSFSNEEIRILTALAELSAIAIQKAQLYEHIVDMEEQLRENEKLSAIGLLAAEVAHEIRNPLTVIKMLYHSLQLNFPAGDPRAQDSTVILERIDHLNKIVEQILQFARTADPSLSPVSINHIVEDLALLTRHKLAQQKIEFIRDLAPALPLIHADAGQLGQAFLNIVLNAAEAMENGGALTISTSFNPRCEACPSGEVLIKFSDTGHGMTEEQQKSAFRSLLQTTKKRGTGLGLAIVARIIEAHRGKIEVSSKPGQGTTFTVSLPIPSPYP